MARPKLLSEGGVYLGLIVVSPIVGWFIPAFYDWTGADQSRPSPWVPWTALLLVVSACALWLALPFLPLGSAQREPNDSPRLRFGIRSLLLTTAAFAVVTALLLQAPILAGGAVAAVAYGYALWHGVTRRDDRWAVAALFSCLLLPYVWLLGYQSLRDLLPELFRLAAGLPGFLPAVLLGGWWKQSLQGLEWLAMLITAAQIVIGVRMIRIGTKLAIAYLVLVLLISTFGSFGLNALVRM